NASLATPEKSRCLAITRSRKWFGLAYSMALAPPLVLRYNWHLESKTGVETCACTSICQLGHTGNGFAVLILQSGLQQGLWSASSRSRNTLRVRSTWGLVQHDIVEIASVVAQWSCVQ